MNSLTYDLIGRLWECAGVIKISRARTQPENDLPGWRCRRPWSKWPRAKKLILIMETELTGIFRGFGEERDEEATGELEAKLNQCPTSDQRDQARVAVEHARQTAEQSVKDFNRLEGV